MNRTVQLLIGIVLLPLGLVLALGYPESDLGWFTGRPLGIVLAVLGAVDIAEVAFSRRSRNPS